MKKIKELFIKYKEIILYFVFGVATTLVNFVIYTVTVELLSLEMTISNALAWLGAVIFAYITNKIFVFESRSAKPSVLLKEMLSFFAARVLSGVVEIVLPTLLFKIGLDIEIFGIKGFAAKAVVNVLIIILNYLFSKLFVFKKRGGRDTE